MVESWTDARVLGIFSLSPSITVLPQIPLHCSPELPGLGLVLAAGDWWRNLILQAWAAQVIMWNPRLPPKSFVSTYDLTRWWLGYTATIPTLRCLGERHHRQGLLFRHAVERVHSIWYWPNSTCIQFSSTKLFRLAYGTHLSSQLWGLDLTLSVLY